MMLTATQELTEALRNFGDVSYADKANACAIINKSSHKLARDPELRVSLPIEIISLWSILYTGWRYLESISSETIAYEQITCLARFTRNLVAGVPENQTRAFKYEPFIRRLLYSLSSFSQLEDKESYLPTRMLVQCLSNMVTMNIEIAGCLWKTYSNLPEQQEVISRLLASKDIQTMKAISVLVLNCTTVDRDILKDLITLNGLRIMIKILDLTEELATSGHEEEEEVFAICYGLFEKIFRDNLASSLYGKLAIEGEPVTPPQYSFLKILDSFLQIDSNFTDPKVSSCDYTFVSGAFSQLVSYLRNAIESSLGVSSSDTTTDSSISHEVLKNLDLRLPKVSAAIVLLAQILNVICLCVHKLGSSNQSVGSGFQAVFNATANEMVIKNLIETLRLIDRFLPRIIFGKIVEDPGKKNLLNEYSDVKGFSYLKRDLVCLVGTICYERKDMQDMVRKCGGIEVVMNLCVIDERNPYLREHALFALRNILFKNLENQTVVNSIKPADNPIQVLGEQTFT